MPSLPALVDAGGYSCYTDTMNNLFVCRDCGSPLVVGSNWSEYRKQQSSYQCQSCRNAYDRIEGKRRRESNRAIVVSAYGGKCECCGETHPEFLSIDHVNKDGSAHRKSVPTSRIYRWLIVNNFPQGFRLLCYNCNMSIAFYGKCPHQQS